jgi:hypothetical protein
MHPECRHVLPNGKKCRGMALRNHPYCYFHNSLHRLALQKVTPKGEKDERPFELPVPEDQSAIQLSLGMVFKALGANKLDISRAKLFLYGLQIASQNVSHAEHFISKFTVPGVTITKDGQELGPKELGCDPDDCKECDYRKHCLHRRVIVGLHGGVDPLDDLVENSDDENKDEDDA